MTIYPFLLAIGLPLAMALTLLWPAARAMVWRMMPLAAVPTLALALLGGVPVSLRGDWLVLGLTMGLDEISRLFVIFTAALWMAAGAAARHWMRDDARATSFGVVFLMAMSGNIGLILSQDAVAFYAAFAMMSFASYGLVIHTRSAAAQGAARVYIGFVILGELALFAGLALAAAQAGSILLSDLRAVELPFTAVALMLLGFGVKLGVMPLHFWLPPAHGAAPAPASAVLSGAMIKAGLYGMIATLPLGMVAYVELATVMMAAGMVTIFAALLLGVQQNNPKTVLGFSSVSQMGIIALGLGAALKVPASWSAILPVLVFLAAHHALAKGALFLGTGAFAVQGSRIGRVLIAAALLVPALVLAGLPFGSGALGKEALKTAFSAGSEVWLPWLTLALTLSGLATTLLMARFLALLWLAPPKAPTARPDALALPFVIIATASTGLPLLWPVLAQDLATPISRAAPGALWPLALGVAVALSIGIHAYAQRIGPTRFLALLAAPYLALVQHAARVMAARRRAARRLAYAVPRALAERAVAWRLGQTAVAALMALVLAVEMVPLFLVEAAPTADFPTVFDLPEDKN